MAVLSEEDTFYDAVDWEAEVKLCKQSIWKRNQQISCLKAKVTQRECTIDRLHRDVRIVEKERQDLKSKWKALEEDFSRVKEENREMKLKVKKLQEQLQWWKRKGWKNKRGGLS